MGKKEKRFKGRYIDDKKYFYIQKKVSDGVDEIMRVPKRDLLVEEIVPDPKRFEKLMCNKKSNKNIIILSLYIGLPIVGVLWGLGLFKSFYAYVIYWVLTSAYVLLTAYSNLRR